MRLMLFTERLCSRGLRSSCPVVGWRLVSLRRSRISLMPLAVGSLVPRPEASAAASKAASDLLRRRKKIPALGMASLVRPPARKMRLRSVGRTASKV